MDSGRIFPVAKESFILRVGQCRFISVIGSTIAWGGANMPLCSDRQSACPLCCILGHLDTAGKKSGKNDCYDVRFGNLRLTGGKFFSGPERIGVQRLLNRVDAPTGKAHDWFRVWEIDDEAVKKFKGVIMIADDLRQREAIVSLLERALGFVDRLCGSMVKITVERKEGDITDGHELKSTEHKNVEHAEEPIYDDWVKSEVEKFLSQVPGNDREFRARQRTLAKAVLFLRAKQLPLSLPKGHKGYDGKLTNHFLWDKLKLRDRQRTVRGLLEDVAGSHKDDPAGWRRFCECLRQKLYDANKLSSQKLGNRNLRTVDDIGLVIRPKLPVSYTDTFRTGVTFTHEWILIGELRAKTPFHVGVEVEGRDQTSLRVLLGRDNRFRLPRSVLRGVPRRDLSLVSVKGCAVQLGPERPCQCPACQIMRQIVIRDSKSEISLPPDIRHHIRRNSVTSTVDEGALFDAENGLEGTSFPFMLRFRGGADLPKDLRKVITWWKDEKLFLGGKVGSGKGRFALKNFRLFCWELTDDRAKADYARECGLRGQEEALLDHEKVEAITGLASVPFAEESHGYPWQEVQWSLAFTGPTLTNDPIASLCQDKADAIFYRKHIIENTKPVQVFALRGEGLRGLVRNALGRVANGILGKLHEDCDCHLCNIFGNEHQMGAIRIEDMIAEAPIEKLVDHVSIDRFDGGVVEKFDDKPLVGSQGNALVFSGTFWLLRDLEKYDEVKDSLAKAFRDIQAGLYPVGAKGGIGYGWIHEVTMTRAPGWLQNREEEADEGATKLLELSEETTPILDLPSWKPVADAIYNPYYFIPPVGGSPDRTMTPISHATLSSDRYTGRISCSLKAISPLLLPDTEHDPEVGNQHREFPAFKLNETVMIPGSGLRSAVSLIYETLTDSCFRVIDQKRTLSWRMETREHADYEPGRVIGDGGQIKPMGKKALRLPLYDQDPDQYSDEYKNKFDELHTSALDKNIRQIKTIPWRNMTNKVRVQRYEKCARILKRPLTDDEKRTLKISGLAALKNQTLLDRFELDEKNCMAKAKTTDAKIAKAARDNWEFLEGLEAERRQRVLSGQEKISFRTENLAANNDISFQIVLLEDENNKSPKKKTRCGYLKITGPNNANEAIGGDHDTEYGYDSDWDSPLDFSFRLSGPPEVRPNTQKSRDYPRPGFECIKGGKRYRISKRCERLFEVDKSAQAIPIPRKIREGYKWILADYMRNSKKIPAAFRSRLSLHEDLREGDLVYYKSANVNGIIRVTALAPVCISRAADDRPLGRRLPIGYQPCSYVCLEDCDSCTVKDCPIPIYREGYPVKGLCPACHLFGAQMYKGRVYFSFAAPDPEEELRLRDVTLPLQERPRPSWVLPRGVQGQDNEIPGRKFYLRHGGWKTIWEKGEDPRTGNQITKNLNNVTIRGIEPGAGFSFKIHFENLSKEELGRLLYCLELEEDMTHALGRGKSFGFGQVKIRVKEISRRLSPGVWHSEAPGEGGVTGSKLVVDALAGLNSLAPLQLLLTQQSHLKVRYPELSNTGKIPGYKELKEKHNYDPYYFLTVQGKDSSKLIYPWYPPPTNKPAVDKKNDKAPSVTSGTDIKGLKNAALPPVTTETVAAATSTGVVKWFNSEYGFIERTGENDLFVHWSAIQGSGYKTLEKGEKVRYEVGDGPKGLCAVKVWRER